MVPTCSNNIFIWFHWISGIISWLPPPHLPPHVEIEIEIALALELDLGIGPRNHKIMSNHTVENRYFISCSYSFVDVFWLFYGYGLYTYMHHMYINICICDIYVHTLNDKNMKYINMCCIKCLVDIDASRTDCEGVRGLPWHTLQWRRIKRQHLKAKLAMQNINPRNKLQRIANNDK